MHFPGNGVERKFRPQVVLKVFEAEADKALGVFLLGRWNHRADDEVKLGSHQDDLIQNEMLGKSPGLVVMGGDSSLNPITANCTDIFSHTYLL